ncbi:hypothetical protein ACFFK7_03160 [Pseudoalteromonas xiamenensis]|uniref:hypothetical protein n=1 Tax=Pseudoalteromonas xiamenensis TaxID=882626 RepID=UPI0035F04607
MEDGNVDRKEPTFESEPKKANDNVRKVNIVSMNNAISLLCPSCSVENKLDFGEPLCCGSCKSSINNHVFEKSKKKWFGTKTTVLLTAALVFAADKQFVEPVQYSTDAIFEIVNACANPNSGLLNYSNQNTLAKACICALKQTMAEVPEAELRGNQKTFNDAFSRNLRLCR